MLTKFETKSNRVKGLSFHPRRPWLLASLHSGVVQLWDYRLRSLLEKFEEHDGPVRGVAFHPTQPLFVSGGDDYKIKVWNYKMRRCLFTLLGHLDYIRTVAFHHEAPWILSASDDQTIRIWNWQNRSSVAVLTGHNHYVMCAAFHPKEDLIVSASLDQTVRVWDVSALRRKGSGGGPGGAGGAGGDDSLRLPQTELFGGAEVGVKHVLEGHDRGVNWATFHPTQPLIASGADDRLVKLWRINDAKSWEFETFRGHYNNVSCVLFHPRHDLMLSNSEDHTIRVWDLAKRATAVTFRREHDRFWVLAAHPELNLFAAGHDSGLLLFKLERERPPFVSTPAGVFYLKDRFLRAYDFASGRDVPLTALRRPATPPGLTGHVGGGVGARTLSFNAAERCLLLWSDLDGGTYELYTLPPPSTTGGASATGGTAEAAECRRGAAAGAVFVARNRFVVLEKSSKQLLVKNLRNETTKQCETALPGADGLFPAPTGCVLLRAEDRVALYDVQQRRILRELVAPAVRYAVWSSADKTANVALLCKDQLILANGRLEQLCAVHDALRVKSAAWDDHGVLLYATGTHLRYCLPNGDAGIVRTLDVPVYLTGVRGNKVHCLDREGRNRVIAVDNTEYLFKLALVRRRYDEVLRMVRESNLMGQAVVAYLQRKGFPEVALHFVKDERTRFTLALECGNIEVALESARVLDQRDAWHRIGVEALRQGNHAVVETAYQRTKNFERLSFLYLITGNVEKLRKMLKIADMRQDAASRLHNAFLLGDVAERVRVLEQAGLLSLAYLLASTHSLDAVATELRSRLTPEQIAALPAPQSLLSGGARLLVPPVPALRMHDANWPLLTVRRGYFDGALQEDQRAFGLATGEAGGGDAGSSWGGEPLTDLESTKAAAAAAMAADGDDAALSEGWDRETGAAAAAAAAAESTTAAESSGVAGEGWDIGAPLEGLPGDEGSLKQAAAAGGGGGGGGVERGALVPPTPGATFSNLWSRGSRLAHDHVLAGQVESAAQLLHQQIGLVNLEPLRAVMVELFMGGRAMVPMLPGVASLVVPLQRNDSPPAPVAAQSLKSLLTRLQSGYRAVTEARFADATVAFLGILHRLPFVLVDTRQDLAEARELLALCREYVLALRLESSRRELAKANKDPARQVELAAYFTHCGLQPPHLVLGLASAMRAAYTLKNLVTAGSFARRLLELNPSKQELVALAQKVSKAADAAPRDEVQLKYDERNPFVVCARTFVPIYKGSPHVECPYCGASYVPTEKGRLCTVCDLAEIDKACSGLTLSEKLK